jgi:hypothetical protein
MRGPKRMFADFKTDEKIAKVPKKCMTKKPWIY